MANSRTSNTILIDSTGSVATASLKVAYILFTPANADDEMTLRETASGNDKIYIRGAVAKQTMIYRIPEVPIVFQNGLYVQTLTSGAKAVLVTTTTGG